jgi:hypothetical protein
MANDEAFQELRTLVESANERNRNEAETRHKIIDVVLHSVLTWPRNRLTVEEYIRPGYADYVLRKTNDDPIILIEAKREGEFFSLPAPADVSETSAYISLEKLLSDAAIKDAVMQVRTYCVDVGCEYAAITNGHEWILFKTFEKSRRWDTMRAFVIRRLDFFLEEYTRAINSLSYTSVVDRSSLASLLTSAPPKDRSIFYSKERVPSFSHPIASNRLAPFLRPLVNRYFGVIGDDDPTFMERCYVSQRDDQHTLQGMRSLIQDALSPHLKEYGIKQLEDTHDGGQIGAKITKAVKRNKKGEVLVLFGGKGAGKSTFIKRLLHYNPPSWLRDHSIVVILDLLKVPEDTAVIRSSLWSNLVEHLDVDHILESERDELIHTLFHERFSVVQKQDLAGLPPASEAYNMRLNSLLAEWKADKAFCAQQLVRYWQVRGKGIVVVLDNTDQYAGHVQDFCFTSAQEVADQLGCTVLISMREERFYNSKIHGVLDAFQNSGFHISSPRPAEVFRKRLEYTEDLLASSGPDELLLDADQKTVQECCSYLAVVRKELAKHKSHLTNFLTACAHGDTRLSLDLFRSFLLSGYTNVDEILSAPTWDFQIHQVIKPVMIPSRYFYDEKMSDIPNIFQLRFNRHCSHFTALRILRKLAKLVEGGTAGYVPVAQLQSHFVETFNMLDDLHSNLDVLLKHGFVEANNRLDFYSDAVDAVKITPYGLYMLNDLAYYFTYLDLVCVDCGLFDEQVSNYTAEAAKLEYDLFMKRDRYKRVELRLDRVDKFIEYLHAEEMREKDAYSLDMPEEETFTFRARDVFREESARVLTSARRRANRR